MPQAARRRASVAIEVLVLGLGAFALCSGVLGQRTFEVPAPPCVAAALALGGLARALSLSPWPVAARAATPLAVALAVGVTAVDESYFHLADVTLVHSFSWVAWLLRLLAPVGLALVGLRLGARALGFVVGVALAALGERWFGGLTSVLVVLGFVAALRAGVTSPAIATRERCTLVPLGALTMLATFGLLHDLTTLGRSLEIDVRSFMNWAEVDSPSTFVIRCIAEGLLIVGAVAMARGKTAGLLLLITATPMLLPTLAGWTELPAYGGGCTAVGHPFGYGGAWWVALASGLAVLPWLRPLWRHLRVARERAPHPSPQN